MPRRPIASSLFALILLVALSPQLACTAMGPLGSSRLDRPSGVSRLVESGDAVTIPPGSRLIVGMRDGRRFEGVFRDTTSLSDAEYALLWQRWLSSAAHPAIPRPGDEVTLVYEHAERGARMEGYHYRSVLLTLTPGDSLVQVPMSSMEALRSADGKSYSGAALAMMDAESALPSRLAIELRVGAGGRGITEMSGVTEYLPCSEIRYLAPRQGDSGAAFGVLIGLAAGVALVAVAVHNTRGPGCYYVGPRSWAASQQPPAGIEVTTAPYDRLAGKLIEPARGARTTSQHAAPAR